MVGLDGCITAVVYWWFVIELFYFPNDLKWQINKNLCCKSQTDFISNELWIKMTGIFCSLVVPRLCWGTQTLLQQLLLQRWPEDRRKTAMKERHSTWVTSTLDFKQYVSSFFLFSNQNVLNKTTTSSRLLSVSNIVC